MKQFFIVLLKSLEVGIRFYEFRKISRYVILFVSKLSFLN